MTNFTDTYKFIYLSIFTKPFDFFLDNPHSVFFAIDFFPLFSPYVFDFGGRISFCTIHQGTNMGVDTNLIRRWSGWLHSEIHLDQILYLDTSD